MKLYVDANVIILAHEAEASLRDKVVRRLVDVVEQPGGVIVTSNRSRLE